MRTYTTRDVVLTMLGIFGFIVFLYAAIVLRDYNISTDGGLHLVSKYPVAGPPGFFLDNTVPNKLTVNISRNGSVSYEVQLSRFKNMWFPRSYRTVENQKSIGLMQGGATYYIRCRSVNNKPGSNRKIVGQWSAPRKIRIAKKNE